MRGVADRPLTPRQASGRRYAINGPRVRRGTVRTRESVPARCAQPIGFASIRVFGTVRTVRTRTAESGANGLVSGYETGAKSEAGFGDFAGTRFLLRGNAGETAGVNQSRLRLASSDRRTTLGG